MLPKFFCTFPSKKGRNDGQFSQAKIFDDSTSEKNLNHSIYVKKSVQLTGMQVQNIAFFLGFFFENRAKCCRIFFLYFSLKKGRNDGRFSPANCFDHSTSEK